MKKMTRKIPKENNSSDSFSARANSYYHERPQLLELLQELYNNYLSLADRYCQTLAKNHQQHHHSRHSSPIPPLKFDDETDEQSDNIGEVVDSDAESSLSFQPANAPDKIQFTCADLIIAELVMKNVEYELTVDELISVEKRSCESSMKIDLQKNLLDVLESERLILLNDNATLMYRVSALVEENKGLCSESVFLKRKASELARCVLKTREDHRVCILSRKIEDLQGQIHGLEKRNKEYYEQLVKQEDKDRKCKEGEKMVNLEDCYYNKRGGGGGAASMMKCFFSFEGKKVRKGGKVSKMWGKVKKMDLFQCGVYDCNSVV